MANVKISDMTAATVPLTGTELVPIVQGGVNKNVAASELGGGAAGSVGSIGIILTLMSIPVFL